jgi:DNA primase
MSVAVEISNPDKTLFPDGLTKADLARYYERIAETMLPHVRGRAVHMQRFPDGIEGEEIQQKQAPDYFPDFVKRAGQAQARWQRRARRDRERRDACLPGRPGQHHAARLAVPDRQARQPRPTHR